jgi:hypothetical protein
MPALTPGTPHPPLSELYEVEELRASWPRPTPTHPPRWCLHLGTSHLDSETFERVRRSTFTTSMGRGRGLLYRAEVADLVSRAFKAGAVLDDFGDSLSVGSAS